MKLDLIKIAVLLSTAFSATSFAADPTVQEITVEGETYAVVTTGEGSKTKGTIKKKSPDSSTEGCPACNVSWELENKKPSEILDWARAMLRNSKKSEPEVATDEATPVDLKFAKLSCQKLPKNLAKAECFAGNLEEIREKAKTDKKYDKLYKEAKRTIKSESVKLFKVGDKSDLEEARNQMNDLYDEASAAGDAAFNAELRTIARNLYKAAKESLEATELQNRFEETLLPKFETYTERLETARENSDLMGEYNARASLNALQLESNQIVRQMNGLNPKNELSAASRSGDINASFIQEQFDRAYEALRLGLGEYGKTAGKNGQTAPGVTDIRQSRNGLGSVMTTSPAYGSNFNIYGSAAVSQDSLNGLTNGNNGFNAAEFLARNPGAASGRGRN